MHENRSELNQDDTPKEIYDNIQNFFNMKIEEVLDKRFWDMPVVEIKDNIFKVLAILCTNDHAWVINDHKSRNILGVITEHDILNSIQPPKDHPIFGPKIPKITTFSLNDSVDLIMVEDPVTCLTTENVEDVINKMETHGVRRLPVIKPDSSEIIGEISSHQLIRKFYNIIKPIFGDLPEI